MPTPRESLPTAQKLGRNIARLRTTAKLTQEEYISGEKKGEKVISISVALAFLAFVLIYFPCIGVIATIKSESGKLKWALFTVVYTTSIAWIISFLVFRVSTYILM